MNSLLKSKDNRKRKIKNQINKIKKVKKHSNQVRKTATSNKKHLTDHRKF